MQFASAISSSTRLGASGIFDRVFSPVVQQLSVAKIRLQADSEPFMHHASRGASKNLHLQSSHDSWKKGTLFAQPPRSHENYKYA